MADDVICARSPLHGVVGVTAERWGEIITLFARVPIYNTGKFQVAL